MLAFAYYQLSVAKPAVHFGSAVAALTLFLVAIVGIAGFGHVLNDAFDVEADRRRGAYNIVAGRKSHRIAALFVLLLVLSSLPWLWLPASPFVLALLALEFALFAAYSIPPVRLKGRGLAGALTDAVYAYTVPVTVSLLVFGQLGKIRTPLWLALVIGGWTVMTGLRQILTHQLEEASRDQLSGDSTFAVRRGWQRTYRLLARRLAPAETSLFVLAILALGLHAPLAPIGLAVFVGWTIFMHRRRTALSLPSRLADLKWLTMLNISLMNGFNVRWLPMLMLVTLGLKDPIFLSLAALHLLVFENGLHALVRYDLPELRRLGRARRRWGVVIESRPLQ